MGRFGHIDSSVRRRPRPGRVAVEALESRRLLSADLVPAFVSPAPAILPAEGKTQIAVQVMNLGDAPASGRVTVELFASADCSLDDGDILLASSVKRMNLKPAKGVAIKLRVPAPTSLASGSYTLIARVTPPATVSESDAGNNIVASPTALSVQTPFVDLAAQIVADPQAARSRHGQGGSVEVTNLGTVTATGGVAVNWFLSTDTVLDAHDLLIASLPMRSIKLAPGKFLNLGGRAFIPSDTPLGTYHLLAMISPGAGIHDANRANDVAVDPQTIVVVNPPPRGHQVLGIEIITEQYYEDVYVVEYGEQVVGQPSPDGSDVPDTSQGPDVYIRGDPASDTQPPLNDGPVTDPAPANDPPPVTMPVPDPPATQPAPEPDPAPPTTSPAPDPAPSSGDNGYSSSGGDF